MPEIESRLLHLFRRHRVLDMEALQTAVGGRSRRSLYRDLDKVGYSSSYTHAGRFYTLAEIPDFDEQGLWFHQGIGFSKQGTLKETIAVDVPAAEAGRTHAELERVLRVRVHNTVLTLVREGRIGRDLFDGLHLYVSPEVSRAADQLMRRERLARLSAEAAQVLPVATVIAILVEVIEAGQEPIDVDTVAARLGVRGIALTGSQVEGVLVDHGVTRSKKRPGSASPRSRD